MYLNIIQINSRFRNKLGRCSYNKRTYIYTISINLAGLPGICLPCGNDSKGLPIGLQLIGDCFKENNIIRAAYSYEQARNEMAKEGK